MNHLIGQIMLSNLKTHATSTDFCMQPILPVRFCIQSCSAWRARSNAIFIEEFRLVFVVIQTVEVCMQ